MRRRKKVRNPNALEQFRLAKACASQREWAPAVDFYLRAIELDPAFAEAHVNLGVLYGQMGEPYAGEALACLRRGVELNRASARGHYNLGVALSKPTGRIDDAIEAFEAAIAIDPSHKNALYALAVQWNRKGDPVKAAVYHQWYQDAMAGNATARAASSPPPRRASRAGAESERRRERRRVERPFLRIRFVR